MECKCKTSNNFIGKMLFRINRYIMECKYLMAWQYTSSGVFELIDTLWNVNVSRFLTRIIRGCGINRYIMECKFSHF